MERLISLPLSPYWRSYDSPLALLVEEWRTPRRSVSMKTAESSLLDYCGAVASSDPTPGGGSVAAVTGALAASLGAMAARFSQGRHEAELDAEIEAALLLLEGEIPHFLELAEEDARAYESFRAALAEPKATPEQKELRKLAIQRAAVGAMEVPLRVARRARELLRSAGRLLEIGNPHLASDVGVLALLSAAAVQSALLNVRVNLPYLGDPSRAVAVREEVKGLEASVVEEREALLGRLSELVD